MFKQYSYLLPIQLCITNAIMLIQCSYVLSMQLCFINAVKYL